MTDDTWGIPKPGGTVRPGEAELPEAGGGAGLGALAANTLPILRRDNTHWSHLKDSIDNQFMMKSIITVTSPSVQNQNIELIMGWTV